MDLSRRKAEEITLMRIQAKITAVALCLVSSCADAPHLMAQVKHASSAVPHDASRDAPRDMAHDASHHVEAFSILQKHYFLGRWQIFLNKDRVKAVNLSDGYSIVTMGPTWKVAFYRDIGGPKMYESTMESFLLTGIPLSGGYVIEGNKASRQHKAMYKGLNTLQLDIPRMERTGAKPAWTLSDVPKDAPVAMSQYWTSPAICNNNPINHFLQKLFMVPTAVGYPVAFVDTRIDKSRNAVLDILSCRGLPAASIQIAYPSPAKYKVCKGQRDITLSTARRASFDDFAEAIGKD